MLDRKALCICVLSPGLTELDMTEGGSTAWLIFFARKRS